MAPIPPIPAAAQPAPPHAYAAPPPALSRDQLGLGLDAWRATPGAAGAQCAPPQGASQTCTIAAAPLGGAYRARDLTYTFEDGRLTRIAFDASIDALPYAAAVVKRQFGAPATTRRDSIQTPDGPLEHLAYT
ncbi:MAG: hypothetical protein INR64_09255, partial [Caulobacteraceae bacterium]|nr:hypothetical protein [Caulobacter sp.]